MHASPIGPDHSAEIGFNGRRGPAKRSAPSLYVRRKRRQTSGSPLFLRNEPNVANPKCFSQSPSVTAGVVRFSAAVRFSAYPLKTRFRVRAFDHGFQRRDLRLVAPEKDQPLAHLHRTRWSSSVTRTKISWSIG